jgi:hypothetical protein
MGLLPLRRSREGGATCPELTSLRTLRSQDFSPSQRVAPRLAVRSCFIPVASLGFHPSERFPLKEPYRLSTAVALLTFTSRPCMPLESATSHQTSFRSLHVSCYRSTRLTLTPSRPGRRAHPDAQPPLMPGSRTRGPQPRLSGRTPSGIRRHPCLASGRSRRRRSIPTGVGRHRVDGPPHGA